VIRGDHRSRARNAACIVFLTVCKKHPAFRRNKLRLYAVIRGDYRSRARKAACIVFLTVCKSIQP